MQGVEPLEGLIPLLTEREVFAGTPLLEQGWIFREYLYAGYHTSHLVTPALLGTIEDLQALHKYMEIMLARNPYFQHLFRCLEIESVVDGGVKFILLNQKPQVEWVKFNKKVVFGEISLKKEDMEEVAKRCPVDPKKFIKTPFSPYKLGAIWPGEQELQQKEAENQNN